MQTNDTELFKQYGGSTPSFSLNNVQTLARVVSVYDGDTMHVIIPVLGSFFKFSLRMYGIDTCEIKSKNASNKETAIKARNRLIELVTKKGFDESLKTKKQIEGMLDKDVYLVWLNCLEMDKYGRVLAKVYSTKGDLKSFSDVLVEENLAYEYFGETKKNEDEQANIMG